MSWISRLRGHNKRHSPGELLRRLEQGRQSDEIAPLADKYLGGESLSAVLEKLDEAMIEGRFSRQGDSLKLQLQGQARTATSVAAELSWGPTGQIVKEVSHHQSQDMSTTECRTTYYKSDGSYAGKLTHSLNSNSGRVHAHLGEMRFSETGGSKAKPLLGELVEQWQASGAEFCSIVAEDVGAYAWLKYGFVPRNWGSLRGEVAKRAEGLPMSLQSETELKAILADDDPKSAWKLAELEAPSLWNKRELKLGQSLLLGQNWAGRLDFQDSESMERFEAYVSKDT